METGTTNVSNTQNKALKKRRPNANFLKYKESGKESFITCSYLLIYHTLSMTIENENQGNNKLGVYKDEMLHSIFFLGYIHDSVRFKPKEIFKTPTGTAYESLKKMFPGPFEKYSSHLPTRTPFSILLNMMEVLYHTEEEILKNLLLLLKEMKFPHPLHKPGSKYEQYYTLESTVISVCYSYTDPQRYYGASLSCRKGNAKRILIDLSCLKTWHKFVSHAVMSFTDTHSTGDGIRFPESVKCQAYIRDWKENVYRKRDPCSNCKDLFNLKDANTDREHFPYGNCAETECLSKLLNNDQYVQENTRIENHMEENLEALRDKTKESLKRELEKVGIQMDEDFQFYSPMP